MSVPLTGMSEEYTMEREKSGKINYSDRNGKMTGESVKTGEKNNKSKTANTVGE